MDKLRKLPGPLWPPATRKVSVYLNTPLFLCLLCPATGQMPQLSAMYTHSLAQCNTFAAAITHPHCPARSPVAIPTLPAPQCCSPFPQLFVSCKLCAMQKVDCFYYLNTHFAAQGAATLASSPSR